MEGSTYIYFIKYLKRAVMLFQWWCCMRTYTVIIIQFMIWSGFTFIEWLSTLDLYIYKIIMFFIFLYLAVVIGNQFIRSTRKTICITFISLSLYSLLHIVLLNIW